MAFSSASKMDFDESIKEDALFNFAKITFELSYSPFNEAIRALNQYIEEYAHSDRIDEAYEFLMQAYLNTKNYQAALESLNKIQNKDNRIRSAYQRVAFYRGLELFSDLKFEDAIDHFDLSLEYGDYDMNIKARSYYWRGEAYYRVKDFEMAFDDYQEFISSAGAFETIEYHVAHYNLGYIFFSEKDYDEALNWFRKYENLASETKSKMKGDALNRIADCYFIRSDYTTAMTYYQRAIDLGLSGADYAMFQKGITLGVNNRHQEKIRVLTGLLENMTSSAYIDDALFERGRSYVVLENDSRAVEDYLKIINDMENSSYVPKALVQLGLVYYNSNRNEEAIVRFKQVIEGYRGSEEAQNALTGLKNVYVDMNEVDAYFSYVRNLGEEITISVSEQDSLTYVAGENLYMAGNCERAVQTLDSYIDRFEQGSFRLNAHFYRAECLMKMGMLDEALASYNYVIDQPRNLFTEPALAIASELNYNAGELFDAIEQYAYLEGVAELPNNLLAARLGLLRSFYQLDNYTNTIEAAKNLLSSDKLTEEMAREAYYKIAKSHYALKQMDLAQSNFRKVASEVKSIEGAESKYRVAEIYFVKEQLDKAEQEINEFLELNSPHPYWMAKMFILDADVKIRKEDYFQAKHILQAIIDYYEEPNDGIIEEASEKYNQILDLEKFLNAPQETDSIEFVENSGNNR
jgi:tetratricopeptide (TPR) repeat protein